MMLFFLGGDILFLFGDQISVTEMNIMGPNHIPNWLALGQGAQLK
jgi:hypothetical protein